MSDLNCDFDKHYVYEFGHLVFCFYIKNICSLLNS